MSDVSEETLTKESLGMWRETAHSIVDALFDRVTFDETGRALGSFSMGQSKHVQGVDFQDENGEWLTRFEPTGGSALTITFKPASAPDVPPTT